MTANVRLLVAIIWSSFAITAANAADFTGIIDDPEGFVNVRKELRADDAGQGIYCGPAASISCRRGPKRVPIVFAEVKRST